MLKPQDIVVTLRLLLAENRGESTTYPLLSTWTGLSASEAHAAIRRLVKAGLVSTALRDSGTAFDWTVVRASLLEFATYALRYLWPVELGVEQRGVSTGWAVNGVNDGPNAVQEGAPWVWKAAEGTTRGAEVKPLYPSVPEAAVRDPLFHQTLAAIDLARAPNPRLRRLGTEWLKSHVLRQS